MVIISKSVIIFAGKIQQPGDESRSVFVEDPSTQPMRLKRIETRSS